MSTVRAKGLAEEENKKFNSEKSDGGRRYRDELHHKLQLAFSFGEVDADKLPTVTGKMGKSFSMIWNSVSSLDLSATDFENDFKDQLDAFQVTDQGKDLDDDTKALLPQIAKLYQAAYLLDVLTKIELKKINAQNYRADVPIKIQHLKKENLDNKVVEEFKNLAEEIKLCHVEYVKSADQYQRDIQNRVRESAETFTIRCQDTLTISKENFQSAQAEIANLNIELKYSVEQDETQENFAAAIKNLENLIVQIKAIEIPKIPDQKNFFNRPNVPYITPNEFYAKIGKLQGLYDTEVQKILERRNAISTELHGIDSLSMPYFITKREAELSELLLLKFSEKEHFKKIQEPILAAIKDQYSFYSSHKSCWVKVSSVATTLFEKLNELNPETIANDKAEIKKAYQAAADYLQAELTLLDGLDENLRLTMTDRHADMKSSHAKDYEIIQKLRQEYGDTYFEYKSSLENTEKNYLAELNAIRKAKEEEKKHLIDMCTLEIEKLKQIDVVATVKKNQQEALRKAQEEKEEDARRLNDRQEEIALLTQGIVPTPLTRINSNKNANEQEVLIEHEHKAVNQNFRLPSPTPYRVGGGLSGIGSVGSLALLVTAFVFKVAFLGFIASNPIGWAGLAVAALTLMVGAITLGVKARNKKIKNTLLQKFAPDKQENLYQQNENLKKQKKYSCTTRHLMMNYGIKIKNAETENIEELACEVVGKEYVDVPLYLNRTNGALYFKKTNDQVVQKTPVPDIKERFDQTVMSYAPLGA
ncbi:MAG: phage holin family protein [Gammaproteobacteria bacterium]